MLPVRAVRAAVLVGLLLVGGAAGASAAGVPTLESLGTLERQATEDALAGRGLRIDAAPGGKRIGQIHVFNHEVFSRRDGYTQLLNVFHFTTREHIIRREVLLQPGDLYDGPLLDESVRNLRDADFSSLVVILPVVAAEPGKVDLLVVTRDVWSLRFNTEFDYGEGTLRALSTSLSENNLFGWRKKFSFVFVLDRGAYGVGPSYYDPNVAGTRLTFSTSLRAYYARQTGEREGEFVSGALAYPLFSLASRWGASLSASHSNLVRREFLGNSLRTVDIAATPEREALPRTYRLRSQAVDAQVVRGLGRAVLHRVAAGYSLSVRRPALLPDFPSADPVVREIFTRAVLPLSELVSSIYLSYRLFTPRYRVYRDYATYDLREDALLGPNFTAAISQAADWLGSEVSAIGLSAGASYTHDWLDGYQRVSASFSARILDGKLRDQLRGASLTLGTPMLRRLVRIVGEAGASVLLDSSRPNVFYTAGAETGLRGYATGEFAGLATWVAHLEARSAPVPVFALRLGAVAFWDVGHAAPRFSDLSARHDVGAGLRLLIPQLNFYVLRVDWAIPLQNGHLVPASPAMPAYYLTRAGFPGRISAGFAQAF
jgi:hypothetical protein